MDGSLEQKSARRKRLNLDFDQGFAAEEKPQATQIDVASAADKYSSGDVSMKDAQLLVALYETYGPVILTTQVMQNIKALFQGEIERPSFENYAFDHDPLFLLARKIREVQDYSIDELFDKITTHSDEDEILDKSLTILQQLVLTDEVSLRGCELDWLYALLEHASLKIADLTARILVSSTSKASSEVSLLQWWSVIKRCLLSRPQVAYKAWIGWSLSQNQFLKGETYKSLLRMSEYWALLQKGVTVGMRSCECTKYCLQILSASLKDLDFDLEIPEMTWKVAERERFLSAWSRYVALVEILCIDTALNQAEDSADDIVALMHPESAIPAVWAISLLEAGLTSNIRDFVYNLILELGEPLRVFNSNPEFLAQKLIPCALHASNFAVEEGRCEYKEKLAAFIPRLCDHLELEQTNAFVVALMNEFSQSVRSYEAPRVIVTSSLSDSVAPILKFESLMAIANYGGLALMGYKSEAMGRLLLANCTQMIMAGADKSALTPENGLDLINKLAINGIQTLDLLSISKWMPDAWLTFLEARASEKPVYGVLYALKTSNMVIPRDQVELVKVINYLSPMFDLSDSVEAIQVVAGKLSSGTAVTEEEFLLLKKFSPAVTVPAPKGVELVDKLAHLQARNLCDPLPVPDVLELLEKKGDAKGFMNGEMRSLHCSSIRHLFDQIDAVTADRWPQLVDLIGRTFLHDEFEPRIAAIQCAKRCLTSLKVREVQSAERLTPVLASIWDAFKEDKLRASEHHVHLEFIDLFTNSKIVDQEDTSGQLEKVAMDIIDESYARRDLMVPLVSGLLKTPRLWVSRVASFAYCYLQTNMTSFHLEELLIKQSGRYSEFFGLPEKAAKVLALDYFTRGHHVAEITKYLFTDDAFKLLTPSKRHDGDEERTRILAYQLLTVFVKFWQPDFALEIARRLLKYSVDLEPSPSARIHVEWIIASIVAAAPETLFDELVLTPLKAHNAPRYVSSLGRIGLLVGKEVTHQLKPRFYQEYLITMLPLGTSNRAPVRHFAVAMMYVIYLDNNIRNCIDPMMLKLVDGIAAQAETVENFKDFRNGDDCVWSISKSLTLTEVAGGLANRVTGRILKDRLFEADFLEALGPGTYGPKEIDGDLGPKKMFHDISMIRDSIRLTNDNIQTKSGSFDGLQPLQRTDLIVVATLCDKPTNLGGICRLCDALGAKLMTLNDLSVSKHPQFKNTAVTADKWMPMLQVAENDLLFYLQEKKREGYALVGIEQTDNSRKLKPDLKFPVKTVLVMGKEREGVPGEVLAHLDFCVEIEQFGMVRSMNIQTATAVLVNAYNNQH